HQERDHVSEDRRHAAPVGNHPGYGRDPSVDLRPCRSPGGGCEVSKSSEVDAASKLERTYKVSLQALILEELDRVSYQGRIAHCPQSLLDNQCRTGQWSYGEPSPHVGGIPTVAPRKELATPADAGNAQANCRPRPKVQSKLQVSKKRDGPDTGDNSNA